MSSTIVFFLNIFSAAFLLFKFTGVEETVWKATFIIIVIANVISAIANSGAVVGWLRGKKRGET